MINKRLKMIIAAMLCSIISITAITTDCFCFAWRLPYDASTRYSVDDGVENELIDNYFDWAYNDSRTKFKGTDARDYLFIFRNTTLSSYWEPVKTWAVDDRYSWYKSMGLGAVNAEYEDAEDKHNSGIYQRKTYGKGSEDVIWNQQDRVAFTEAQHYEDNGSLPQIEIFSTNFPYVFHVRVESKSSVPLSDIFIVDGNDTREINGSDAKYRDNVYRDRNYTGDYIYNFDVKASSTSPDFTVYAADYTTHYELGSILGDKLKDVGGTVTGCRSGRLTKKGGTRNGLNRPAKYPSVAGMFASCPYSAELDCDIPSREEDDAGYASYAGDEAEDQAQVTLKEQFKKSCSEFTSDYQWVPGGIPYKYKFINTDGTERDSVGVIIYVDEGMRWSTSKSHNDIYHTACYHPIQIIRVRKSAKDPIPDYSSFQRNNVITARDFDTTGYDENSEEVKKYYRWGDYRFRYRAARENPYVCGDGGTVAVEDGMSKSSAINVKVGTPVYLESITSLTCENDGNGVTVKGKALADLSYGVKKEADGTLVPCLTTVVTGTEAGDELVTIKLNGKKYKYYFSFTE